jgi:hypothetical protein
MELISGQIQSLLVLFTPYLEVLNVQVNGVTLMVTCYSIIMGIDYLTETIAQ